MRRRIVAKVATQRFLLGVDRHIEEVDPDAKRSLQRFASPAFAVSFADISGSGSVPMVFVEPARSPVREILVPPKRQHGHRETPERPIEHGISLRRRVDAVDERAIVTVQPIASQLDADAYAL